MSNPDRIEITDSPISLWLITEASGRQYTIHRHQLASNVAQDPGVKVHALTVVATEAAAMAPALPKAAWPAGTRGPLSEDAYDADQMHAFCASAPVAAMAATVPAGWKLVPLVATEAMTDAAHQTARLEHEEEGEECCGWFLDNPEEVYAAMLAAAPKEAP